MEINKEEVEQRFRRSRISYNDNARVQKMVVNRMIPMILSSVKRVPEKILEIGCGTGLLTSQLQRTFSSDGLYLNDLVEELCYHAATVNRVSLTHCFPGAPDSGKAGSIPGRCTRCEQAGCCPDRKSVV